MQSLVVLSHEDTPIKLNKDGSLEGLPEKYSPARFDSTTFTLTIGKNSIVIPECIKDYFKHYKDYQISFSSSWYHYSETLPDYIHLDIVTEEEPYGYQIFFNLETLEILLIYKLEEMKYFEGKTYALFFNEQVISEECHDAISNSIVKE